MRGRVIAILSGKGGVGKTTTVANIGVSLAKDFKKQVVAIDANTTSSGLGIHLGSYSFPKTLRDVLKGTNVWEALYVHPSGLKLLPSATSVENFDLSAKKLKKIVDELKEKFDYVLLDCAPTLGQEAIAGMYSADEVIIVTNPEWPSLLEAKRTLEYAKYLNKKIIGVVLTQVYKNLSEEFLDKLIQIFGVPIIGIIREDKKVRESIEKRVPTIHLNPSSKASKGYKAILEFITGEKYPNNNLLNSIKQKLLSLSAKENNNKEDEKE